MLDHSTPQAVVQAFVEAVNRQNWEALEALVAAHFMRRSNAAREAWAEWDNLHTLRQLGHLP